ncbi:MAG: hypothetical protein L0Y72_17635 [Gemmataceae bacterium]|nr:hypothetical protein [Gemmataceae bacterium]MCI0740874.1 hypothetical protein [Gemmataceae bacterium]
MTVKELEKRLASLEKRVAELAAKMNHSEKKQPWWISQAGIFANDPDFDEVVQLGREYRQSLHPDYKKMKKKGKRNNAGS